MENGGWPLKELHWNCYNNQTDFKKAGDEKSTYLYFLGSQPIVQEVQSFLDIFSLDSGCKFFSLSDCWARLFWQCPSSYIQQFTHNLRYTTWSQKNLHFTGMLWFSHCFCLCESCSIFQQSWNIKTSIIPLMNISTTKKTSCFRANFIVCKYSSQDNNINVKL